MFIRKWQLMFLYIGLMDWGRTFDRHSRNGGGAFANENCQQCRALINFFKFPGGCSQLELTRMPGDCPGEGFSWLELARTLSSHHQKSDGRGGGGGSRSFCSCTLYF